MVISPNAKPGFISNVDYDTSSYVKTVESMMGLGSLPCDLEASSVNTMGDLFTVSLSGSPKVAATAELAKE
jgi:hypothetical protein